MKTLIIAEKPSVAKDIASALGVSRFDRYYENDSLIISNCIGHLVGLHVPVADEKNTPLPIIPKVFELAIQEKTKDQYKILEKLLHRKDVENVVNACDAGREGELIFRLVYEKAACTKPMYRMWLQSMTEQAIKEAWQSRQKASQYDALADAARSRAEADWLYGINGSRLVGSSVGRVMTPTLAMVVDRYNLNQRFKAVPFFKVKGVFTTPDGQTYTGFLQQQDKTEEADRFNNKEAAQAVLTQLPLHSIVSVKNEVKSRLKKAPPLFHLTALQQEANKKFGFSAAKTLQIAQALYEQYKVLSYPRTDANALPEDYVTKAQELVGSLSKVSAYTNAAQPIMAGQWVSGQRRDIFDNAKISDHYAIIPTGRVAQLAHDEQLIFDLVVRRFLAAFYPSAEYEQVTRLSVIGDKVFKSTGSILKMAGWLSVYGQDDDEEKEEALAPCGQSAYLSEAIIEEGKTKPPALYTEATLLKAMETAGKQVEDSELAAALKDKGLGTPATRATIIEKLKSDKAIGGAYITQQKNALIPTPKGLSLIESLRGRYAPITSAELTGEWESRLKAVEQGKLGRTDYMRAIVQAVYDFSNAIKQEPIAKPEAYPSIGHCPCCNTALSNRKFSHQCTNCGFNISKEIAGLKLKDKDIIDLIEKGKTKKLKGFVSKAGKEFEAYLVVNKETRKVDFNFDKQ